MRTGRKRVDIRVRDLQFRIMDAPGVVSVRCQCDFVRDITMKWCEARGANPESCIDVLRIAVKYANRSTARRYQSSRITAQDNGCIKGLSVSGVNVIAFAIYERTGVRTPTGSCIARPNG
jgi:hypothetical protein